MIKTKSLEELRVAFDNYLNETYPHITIAGKKRHWERFLIYLTKELK